MKFLEDSGIDPTDERLQGQTSPVKRSDSVTERPRSQVINFKSDDFVTNYCWATDSRVFFKSTVTRSPSWLNTISPRGWKSTVAAPPRNGLIWISIFPSITFQNRTKMFYLAPSLLVR